MLDNGFVPETYGDLAVAICSEPYGIGADGFIIVRTEPQLEMVFYNSDGSRAPMCGNGIRCFAKYCIDEKIRTEDVFKVKTAARQMVVDIKEREPFLVEVDMGRPLFDPAKCAIDTEAAGRSASEPFMNVMLEIDNGKFVNVSSIFMGTIHTVIWTDDLNAINKESLIHIIKLVSYGVIQLIM